MSFGLTCRKLSYCVFGEFQSKSLHSSIKAVSPILGPTAAHLHTSRLLNNDNIIKDFQSLVHSQKNIDNTGISSDGSNDLTQLNRKTQRSSKRLYRAKVVSDESVTLNEKEATSTSVALTTELCDLFAKGSFKRCLSLHQDNRHEFIDISSIEILLQSSEAIHSIAKDVDGIVENYAIHLMKQFESNVDPDQQLLDLNQSVTEFIDMCRTKVKFGYLYCYKLLNFLSFNRNSIIVQNEDLISMQIIWFQTAIELCHKQWKWRTLIDLLKIMQVNKLPLSPQILKTAIITCCMDYNSGNKAVLEAYAIFRFMMKSKIPRDEETFMKLIHSLNREELYSLAESVWIQLRIESSVTSKPMPISMSMPMPTNSEEGGGGMGHYQQRIPLQLTDQLYALYIASLLGLQRYHEAIKVYKSVHNRFKNPMHSYIALFGGINRLKNKNKNSLISGEVSLPSTEDIDALKKDYDVDLSSQHISQHIKKLFACGEYALAKVYLMDYLSEKDVGLVSFRIWSNLMTNLLRERFTTEAIEVLKFLRTISIRANAHHTDSSDSWRLFRDLKLSKWTLDIMVQLGVLGQVETALALAESEGDSLSDDAAAALVMLLIRNDQAALALQLLRKRYVPKRRLTDDRSYAHIKIPFAVSFNVLKVLIDEGLYEHIPIFLSVVSESTLGERSQPQDAADMKGAAVVTHSPKQAQEMKHLLSAAILRLSRQSSSVYSLSGQRISSMIISLLQQEADMMIRPSYDQIRNSIRCLSAVHDLSSSSHFLSPNRIYAEQILHIFSLRRSSDGYRPGDEKMYDIAMKACDTMGKWELTIHYFKELLEEKKKLSVHIYDTIIMQLGKFCSDGEAFKGMHLIKVGIMAHVYQEMASQKIRPSSKVEPILLRYLPKDLRNQLQRDIVLFSDDKSVPSV